MKKSAVYAVAIYTLSLLQFGLFIGADAQQPTTPPVLKPPTIDIKEVLLTTSPLIDVEYQGEL